MSVPTEFISVILRLSTLEARYPGGRDAYARDFEGGSYASDGWLVRVGFMSPADTTGWLEHLQRSGLRALDEAGEFLDVAVIDQFGGPTRRCRWLEWDGDRCWLSGTDPGESARMRADEAGNHLPMPVESSLLGLALGDCLGAGREGRSAESIRAEHAQTGGLVKSFAFSSVAWTDDTQQALTLIESIARRGSLDAQWVAKRWVLMTRRGLHRGTGRGFRASIDEFVRTGDVTMSGRTDRGGNGAAMRIAPAAAALRHLEDESFVEQLVTVSLLTHREVRALAGMLAVAYVARAMARQDRPENPMEARVLLGRLVEWLQEQEERLASRPSVVATRACAHEISAALQCVADQWGRSWEVRRGYIEAFASERRGKPTRIADGFVTASVVGAIAWALVCRELTAHALETAVSFGDDADTFAAMVGGMLGTGRRTMQLITLWGDMAGHAELATWGRFVDRPGAHGKRTSVLEIEARLSRIRYGGST